MNRLQSAFAHGKAFIPFVTAGDPDLETTERLVLAMAAEGADLIELGIPFSDPVAEGPVIQAADMRALAAGTTTDGIFALVRRLRAQTQVPLAFMTYANPVFAYGAQRFLANCAEAGVDALIMPDLPFEEREELLEPCDAHDVMLISLIAPTSKERIATIAREARGFIYCVSSMGVTGVRSAITGDVADMVAAVKAARDIPVAVGFGISIPQQAAAVARYADGAIVGSAIVKIVAEHGKDSVEPVRAYVRAMKAALAKEV